MNELLPPRTIFSVHVRENAVAVAARALAGDTLTLTVDVGENHCVTYFLRADPSTWGVVDALQDGAAQLVRVLSEAGIARPTPEPVTEDEDPELHRMSDGQRWRQAKAREDGLCAEPLPDHNVCLLRPGHPGHCAPASCPRPGCVLGIGHTEQCVTAMGRVA